MNKRVRDLINESGAGLWGTDKARERLQKDTPGQEIKSLVKKSQKVSEAADPKGTIKVVKQDKVRYITKDELNTYRQMGWKQAEKRPQGDDKIRAAKKAHAAGTWDGNVNKDGKPIVHIDGKPVVVEDVKNPYKAYDNQKLQQLKRNMRDNVANLTQRIRKRAGNASQSLKDELKDLERKSKLIDLALRDSAKQSDAKRAGVGSDRETFRDRQKRLGKPQTEALEDSAKESIRKRIETMQDEQDRLDKIVQEKQEEKKRIRQQNVDNNTKNIAYKKIDRLIDQLEDRHRRIQIEKELLRDKLSESVQLNELKVSFKFDKLADAAKAERKANQMKKLNVDSEKIQGKMMWLLHVTGSFTDIMKYLRRNDLENKVHESKEMSKTEVKAGDDCSCCGNKIDEHGKCGCDESCKHCGGHHNISEGSESWEAGYKRRVVKTTKPEHKEKGYNWRIKGKDKAHLTIKLYKDKPSQEEFNKQMKRVAGHEFGG